MTDDEILRKAEEITARRKRAARGRAVMNAHSVQIVAWDKHDMIERISIEQDANLAAMLCRVLDCDLTEGAEK